MTHKTNDFDDHVTSEVRHNALVKEFWGANNVVWTAIPIDLASIPRIRASNMRGYWY